MLRRGIDDGYRKIWYGIVRHGTDRQTAGTLSFVTVVYYLVLIAPSVLFTMTSNHSTYMEGKRKPPQIYFRAIPVLVY